MQSPLAWAARIALFRIAACCSARPGRAIAPRALRRAWSAGHRDLVVARYWLAMPCIATAMASHVAVGGEPAQVPAAALSQDATPVSSSPRAADGVLWSRWNAAPTAEVGLEILRLLVASHQMDRARDHAAVLGRGFADNAVVRSELGYFWFQVQDFQQAMAEFAAAIRGQDWTPDQRRNLHIGLANSARAKGDLRAEIAALQPLCAGADGPMLLRLGQTQLDVWDRRAALATGRKIVAVATDATTRGAGSALVQAALKPNPSAPGFRSLTQAYAYLRQGNDHQGLVAFQSGFALGAGAAFHYADAAYAAKRLGDNATAAAYFRFALDLDEVANTFGPQKQFGYRRETEVLERQFGVLIGSPYAAGLLNVWQVGAEGYWQPSAFGYRNGRVVQVFARAFENIRNGDVGAVGTASQQAGVGVRYKPLATHNLMVTGERLMALGEHAIDEWLVRVGYSTGVGTDLSVDRGWWPSWQVFAEASWYVLGSRLLCGGEARYGPTLPLPMWPRLTVNPHALAAVEFDTASAPKLVDALGPGINLRLWFDEDRYRAPRGWLEIHASYRWADAGRGDGPMLRATLSR